MSRTFVWKCVSSKHNTFTIAIILAIDLTIQYKCKPEHTSSITVMPYKVVANRLPVLQSTYYTLMLEFHES